VIDTHIHLDQYKDVEISEIVNDASTEALIAVSMDLPSRQKNLALSKTYPKVKAAFGYHPEQALPTEKQFIELCSWMNEHRNEAIAIGEVGLPYYRRLEQKIAAQEYERSIELLETLIEIAQSWQKPLALHAVYDDAPVVCDLLEKYSWAKAHFHWFKGDPKTLTRMIENGYFVSITPDVVYEKEIQALVKMFPLEQLLIETDGPWPFEGIFSGMMTHPKMMEKSVEVIASIKRLPPAEVGAQLLQNARSFYQINISH
jgi:TatD DNase family protein